MVTEEEKFANELEQQQKDIENAIDQIFLLNNSNLSSDFGCWSAESIKAFQLITQRGGKRLRGILLIEAYKMFGGKNLLLATKAAAAIELLHAYLLIIDDFCDQSSQRRGGESAHVYLSNFHRSQNLNGDSDHFGASIAINAAIYGMHLASNEILSLDTLPSTIIKLHRSINKNFLITAHGQINDIFNESLTEVDEKMIRDVLSWKTGYYTFLNPLEIGSILAEAPESEYKKLADYALPLGVAFQLQDDIIGTFGNELETGKSNMDDVREGKMTLLYHTALELSSAKDRAFLKSSLGDKYLTIDSHEKIKIIITKCGALQEMKKQYKESVVVAIKALQNIKAKDEEPKVFLKSLALYIENRSA